MSSFIPVTADKKRWWNRRYVISITIDECEGKWAIQFGLEGSIQATITDFPSREAAERWLKPYVPMGGGND